MGCRASSCSRCIRSRRSGIDRSSERAGRMGAGADPEGERANREAVWSQHYADESICR